MNENIKVIRATEPGHHISMFDVYVDGKYIIQVRANSPAEAKKVFARRQLTTTSTETSKEKLLREYYSPLRTLFR